jgi:catechol 2,3-dioxygenase-like lactoylglutathione lyase family enzyme
MSVKRMDHAGIVVEDLQAAIAFFVELGLELEGQTTVEGDAADKLIGEAGVRADIAMLKTPDGHSRVELSTFHAPAPTKGVTTEPVNTPGIPRLAFVIDSVDENVERLRPLGAELVGEIVEFGDVYRYGYVRGPGGVIVGLVEELT